VSYYCYYGVLVRDWTAPEGFTAFVWYSTTQGYAK